MYMSLDKFKFFYLHTNVKISTFNDLRWQNCCQSKNWYATMPFGLKNHNVKKGKINVYNCYLKLLFDHLNISFR